MKKWKYEEMEICFCMNCMRQIKNRNLMSFWKESCVHHIITSSPIRSAEKDKETIKYIAVLEKKGFLVSTEQAGELLYIPQGVIYDDDSYVVCISPEKHLSHTTPQINT